MPIDLPDQLREAYEQTTYCVFTKMGELHIRIGEDSPSMDKLLTDNNVSCAAFVTAWNPASKQLSDAENNERTTALKADLAAAGFGWLEGEGRDAIGEWPAEHSLLILGISKSKASSIAEKYGQNAYVLLVVGRAAELVFSE